MQRPWRVVAVLVILAFITIVDRVCISAAKPTMAAELHIPDLSFGWVFGAFALGYAVFMFPSGWAGDRLGPRRFLSLIACCWSLCTVLTGLVRSLPILVAVRFIFGGAEAGAFPAAAKAIYEWVPTDKRGLAMGLLNTGSRLGAALGLVAIGFSVERLGWRTSFVLLGLTGFTWAIAWFAWFHDKSSRKSRSTGFHNSLFSTNSALILFQYFASNFTFFICFSWLLPYLHDRFKLSATQSGIYAGIPLYCGAAATWMGGLAVDLLYKRKLRTLSRKLPAVTGFLVASVSLVFAAYTTSVEGFTLCFAITTFGVDFTLSPSWTTCSDFAEGRTGTLSGAMNTAGSLGSFASSLSFPWLLGMTGGIKTYFFAAALLNVCAASCWWTIKSNARSLD